MTYNFFGGLVFYLEDFAKGSTTDVFSDIEFQIEFPVTHLGFEIVNIAFHNLTLTNSGFDSIVTKLSRFDVYQLSNDFFDCQINRNLKNL